MGLMNLRNLVRGRGASLQNKKSRKIISYPQFLVENPVDIVEKSRKTGVCALVE